VKILFNDETAFNRHEMTNIQNSHVWSLGNLHASTEIHFQSRFCVNVWCGVTGNVCTWRSLNIRALLPFPELELPVLLHVALDVRGELWAQQNEATPSFW